MAWSLERSSWVDAAVSERRPVTASARQARISARIPIDRGVRGQKAASEGI
jgi:hypothetical protein